MSRTAKPKGLKGDSPGQRPGFAHAPLWPALKGRHRREFRPFRALQSGGTGDPGRGPGLSHLAPLGQEKCLNLNATWNNAPGYPPLPLSGKNRSKNTTYG